MTETSKNRSRLIRKLSKGLILSTPLVVAAFSVSPIANAQSSNCPAGSKLSSDGFCMVTSTYEAPTPEATGEAEAESTYKAQSEATGEAEARTAYKAQPEATGEAEAGSAYKAQPEATGEAEAPADYSSSYKAQSEATGEAEAEPEAKGEAEASAEPEAKGEAEASNRAISSGVWTKKNFKAKGAWTLAVVDGVTTISLDDDFSTRNAPDLKIFLSPLSAKEVKNKTAVPGSLLISPLKSNKGAQSYTIPAGTDLSQYKSVIIHCEAYTKLWSASDL